MIHRGVVKNLAVAAALALAVGCTEKRTYSISVLNRTPEKLTLWLTKDEPTDERGWESPEQLAATSAPIDDANPPVVVPPGKTASAGPITGEFHKHARAILRIYLGQPSFGDLLGISLGSPNRADIALHPGRNRFVVDSSQQPLTVTRSDAGR